MSDFELEYVSAEPRAETTGRPPVLFLFHGYGSNKDDLFGLVPYLDPRYLCVSVQAPLSLASHGMPGGRAWFHIQFHSRGIDYDPAGVETALTTTKRFLPAVTQKLGGDPERIVLLGFSQGAMMAHALFLKEPDSYAGIVGLSGRMVDELFSDDYEQACLANKPVFLSHGRHDMVLPIDNGRQISGWYQRSPAALTSNEYDMGHEINGECLQDMQRWLADRV